jgi:hypothetical protein
LLVFLLQWLAAFPFIFIGWYLDSTNSTLLWQGIEV